MSTSAGKVVVDGVITVDREKLFSLEFLQSANPRWAGKPFFASYDPNATWLGQLKPASGQKNFFFEHEAGEMLSNGRAYRQIPIAQASF